MVSIKYLVATVAAVVTLVQAKKGVTPTPSPTNPSASCPTDPPGPDSPTAYKTCAYKCHSSALANQSQGSYIPGFQRCTERCWSCQEPIVTHTLCQGFCFQKTLAVMDAVNAANVNRQAGECILTC
ncbi:hypothetical protein B0O80DRAFT_421147 [Mortierella sp. GBAus27b]|nr:hypothetical protein B0O80DRAFT_421147 [Mortierella sp. GBAus27b]